MLMMNIINRSQGQGNVCVKTVFFYFINSISVSLFVHQWFFFTATDKMTWRSKNHYAGDDLFHSEKRLSWVGLSIMHNMGDGMPALTPMPYLRSKEIWERTLNVIWCWGNDSRNFHSFYPCNVELFSLY